MSSEWIYTEDEDGNRTGLVEVNTPECDTVNDVSDDSTWYSSIEAMVIKRHTQRSYRSEISPREQSMLKTEISILQHHTRSGYCPADYPQRVVHRFYTPSGLRSSCEETVTRQNVDYVCGEMQQRMASYGVNHMTIRDIIESLNVISAVYQSADANGFNKPILALNIKPSTRKKSA